MLVAALLRTGVGWHKRPRAVGLQRHTGSIRPTPSAKCGPG
ncbi:hypothetical protein CASFOL_031132 [Castilleja foliolosa]|uniref:Transposase n=1 Tax=Castilleja foliolosa TaxID=1961234 RepID=A0ABD3C4G7_9LAMI